MGATCRIGVPVFVSVALAVVMLGCSAQKTYFGLVEVENSALLLRSVNGATLRLIPADGDDTLRWYGGKLVKIEGRRTAKGIKVQEVELDLGISSLPAYVGVLRRVPQGVLLYHEASGAGLLVDEASRPLLEPYIGRRVMVEGLVSPGRIDVLNWRVVDEGAR